MMLFLDTNIILDFFLERKPFYYSAAALLTLAEEEHKLNNIIKRGGCAKIGAAS